MEDIERKKAFVQGLYAQYDVDKKPTKELAYMIKTVTNDSLTGEKYIFELLQNANDAARKVESSVSVDFAIVGDYLIFQHDGKPFDQDDVDGIASAANPNRKKVDDLEAIGHKGIGFKAVFTISDWVYIRSGGYTFRFDKSHESWAQVVEHCPWQVIPIWTEDEVLPDAFTGLPDKKVTLILKLHGQEKEKIVSQLNALMRNDSILLFLDYIKEITFKHDNTVNKTLVREVEAETFKPGNKLQTVVVRGEFGSHSWFIYQKTQTILPEITASLCKSSSVPKKYKTARSIKISIAMRSDGARLIPDTSDSQLFCYLPTSISFKLPFLVNADFFLETSRAYLKNDDVSNVWHGFILGVVFELQFAMLNTLGQRQSLGKSTLTMLANPKKIVYGHLESHRPSHVALFNKGIASQEVVSCMSNSSVLLKVKDAQIDTHRFVETFGPESHRNFCVPNDLVEGSLQVLKENGAGEIGPKEIVELLTKADIVSQIKDPQTNKKLCEFLHECYQAGSHSSPNPFEGLKKAVFILNVRSELKSPFSDLALPNKALMYVVRSIKFLNIVHPVVAKLSSEVCATFGLVPITLESMIAAANKNQDQMVVFTRKIFAWHQLGKLVDEDYKKLEQLKVKTTSGELKSTKVCFLSDAYMPELLLENLLENGGNFLSPDYMEGSDQNKILGWREFFRKLGVTDKLNKENVKVFVRAINQETNASRVRFLSVVMSYFREQHDYYTAELAQEIAGVEIVTTRGNCLAKECYLSNCYRPEMPLEGLVDALNYVSKDYLDVSDEVTPEEWLQFFKSLGVRDKLTCTVKSVTRPSLEAGSVLLRGYIDFLNEPANLTHDACLQKKLCSADTAQYPKQHSITKFIEIEFIEKIITSPVFWKVLHDNFNVLRAVDGIALYRTLYTVRKIPTNVRYYVNYVLRKTYNKLASELYGPALQDVFTENELEGLIVAEVASALSPEEQAFFGFKMRFTASDATRVLNRLASIRNVDIKKISRLYRDIANDESAEQITEPSALLAESGDFCSSSQVLANVSRFLQVSHPATKKWLLKRPLDLSDDEFLSFCKKLNLNCITDSNVEVFCQKKSQTQKFSELVIRKLPLLVLVDAYYQRIEQQDLESFSNERIIEILNIVENLRFVLTPVISIRYNDLLSEEVDCWYSASEQTIYFNHEDDTMVLEEIAKFIGIALNLKIEPDVLRSIFYDNNEMRVIRKLNNCHLSEGNIDASIRVVNKLISLEPEAREKERKRLPEETANGTDQQNKRSKVSEEGAAPEHLAEQPEVQEQEEEKHAVTAKGGRAYSEISRSTLFSAGVGIPPKRDREAVREERGVDEEDKLEFESQPGEVKKGKPTIQLKIDALTRKQRKEIGYKGELYVYRKLQEHYEAQGYVIEENEDGFFAKKDEKIKTVIWPNKKLKGESVLHYDFHITGGKNECYIEIKSSLWGSEEDSTVTISEDEYGFMKECAENQRKYRIYYVYNLRKVENGEDPSVKEIKRPYQEKFNSFKEKKVYEFKPL